MPHGHSYGDKHERQDTVMTFKEVEAMEEELARLVASGQVSSLIRTVVEKKIQEVTECLIKKEQDDEYGIREATAPYTGGSDGVLGRPNPEG